MAARPHSPAFVAVRDRLLALEERDMARLARFFGAMGVAQGPLGARLREIAALSDDDLERFASCFA